MLCSDIGVVHAVHPMRLLVFYCSFSLLSSLYFIPAGLFTTIFNF